MEYPRTSETLLASSRVVSLTRKTHVNCERGFLVNRFLSIVFVLLLCFPLQASADELPKILGITLGGPYEGLRDMYVYNKRSINRDYVKSEGNQKKNQETAPLDIQQPEENSIDYGLY